MNKKQIAKTLIIGNIKCTGWMFLYSFIQIIVAIILFYFYINYSTAFQFKFLETFNWFRKLDELSEAEYIKNMLISLYKFTDILILPIIGISGLIMVGILLIQQKRNKEMVIKPLSVKSTISLMFIASIINLVLSTIISMIPVDLDPLYSESISIALGGSPILMIIVTGILGPIAEEVTFRHFIYNSFKEKETGVNNTTVRMAIVLSALSFGLMHGNIIQGTYAFIIGVIFAYIDESQQNILPSIIMHITINLSSVLITVIGINETLGLILTSLMVGTILFGLRKETA